MEDEPPPPLREVVLFADTFNRYFERENLDAALGVLVAAGYHVHAALPVDGDERPLCAPSWRSARWMKRAPKCSARSPRSRLM